MSGEFVATIGDVSNLPELLSGEFLKGRREPRVAMVGRSNVGKSSLINTLLGASVAQTSKQPGKTRCIHFYAWRESGKIIADLPGYGYARAGHGERERWNHFIEAYFKADPGLEGALVLLDARHGPTELDLQAIRFLSSLGIPVNFVFAKSDTLKTQAERARRHKEAGAAIQKLGYPPELAHWVSSRSRDGLKALALSLGVTGWR
jgi:GTP-binding protein